MIVTEFIKLQTRGETDIVDITPDLQNKVVRSGITRGTVTVFVSGSTASITTIEYEDGLIADFKSLWDRIAPRGLSYQHNERWGDGNGYAHVRASLLGGSLVIPIADGRLLLGTWQQVILVDFDNRPRSRQIILQIMGE
jgi:secondary thiamine-phosphate synthase enzyme